MSFEHFTMGLGGFLWALEICYEFWKLAVGSGGVGMFSGCFCGFWGLLLKMCQRLGESD